MATNKYQQDNNQQDQRPLLVIAAERISNFTMSKFDFDIVALGFFIGMALGATLMLRYLWNFIPEDGNSSGDGEIIATATAATDDIDDIDDTADDLSINDAEESSDSYTPAGYGWALYYAQPEAKGEIPSCINLESYPTIKVVKKTDEWTIMSFVWDSRIGTILVHESGYFQSFYGWNFEEEFSGYIKLELTGTNIHQEVDWINDEGYALVSVYHLTE